MVYIEEAHLNDIGTVFRITVYDTDSTGTASILDISAATTIQIIFRKSDGNLLTKTATLTTDGSDGQMQYTTVDGDLNVGGTWNIQSKIVSGDGTWKTDVGSFKVYENL